MRSYFLVLQFSIIAALYGQDFSKLEKPTNFVNDYAQILKENDRNLLEKKLAHYSDSTGISIYVVSTSSLENQKIEIKANHIFANWDLNQDKNVLVLVTKNHPMFIKTSQSLKSSISNITCHQIVLYTLMPSFKNKEYFEGLEIATAQLIGDTSGEYKQKYEKGNSSSALLLALIIFFIIFVLIPFAKYKVLQSNQVDGKPLNFFTAMMLMNLIGGKKGSFSDFSSGKGLFEGSGTMGGGGKSGNW